MSDNFWLFCNHYACRVVEFYTEGGSEDNCPACGNPGDSEAM